MGYWNNKADIWESWTSKCIKMCIYCKSGKWQIIFTGGDLPCQFHSFKQFHLDTSLRNRHLQNEVSSVCFSLSASVPAVWAKAGKMQTHWLSAILYWHKEGFFFLSWRQKFKQSRIWSSLFGVHCKCVFDLKGINYSNHHLLVMSFPVSREQPATGNELQEYILSTFLTCPTIFPLFDVWVCYPLLYVCVCVKNREAKITCFQMFHSDTCPLELIMKTRLFALHVRRNRHTYITDTLMYTNIRKWFTFIRVSLKEGTYLTELLEVIHLGPRLCSMFHSKVNISCRHDWLPLQALLHAVRFYFHD